MPFTPYHMGPGILAKALLRGSFSLIVFGWTQIVMDVQPLIVEFTNEGRYHGFTHTYVGATLLAVVCALTGKYLAELVLGVWPRADHKRIGISWGVAFLSAFIGAYSHVLLDSFTAPDITPFAPFTNAGGLWGLLSVATLHTLCLYSALVGAVLYFAVSYLLSRRNKRIQRTA